MRQVQKLTSEIYNFNSFGGRKVSAYPLATDTYVNPNDKEISDILVSLFYSLEPAIVNGEALIVGIKLFENDKKFLARSEDGELIKWNIRAPIDTEKLSELAEEILCYYKRFKHDVRIQGFTLVVLGVKDVDGEEILDKRIEEWEIFKLYKWATGWVKPLKIRYNERVMGTYLVSLTGVITNIPGSFAIAKNKIEAEYLSFVRSI